MGILAPAADERVAEVLMHNDLLSVRLKDGRIISVPLEWYPRLKRATPEQRMNFEVSGSGLAIHWPDVDEDLSTEGLLLGIPAAKGTLPIRRKPVSGSSTISSMGYSREAKMLEVEFSDGEIYRYLGVPESEYRNFLEASSKGAYLNRKIKKLYRHLKVA